jgi:hypothetical protein
MDNLHFSSTVELRFVRFIVQPNNSFPISYGQEILQRSIQHDRASMRPIPNSSHMIEILAEAQISNPTTLSSIQASEQLSGCVSRKISLGDDHTPK